MVEHYIECNACFYSLLTYKNAYKFTENNPMIVTPEVFDAVQIMRGSRTNILRTDDGQVKRKSTKYSSKEKK